MLAGIRRYVRQHHIGLLALFIALGGTAWAAATINGKDVVDNSLKSVDLKDGKGVKAAERSLRRVGHPGIGGVDAAGAERSRGDLRLARSWQRGLLP